jgi:hypothetical protein
MKLLTKEFYIIQGQPNVVTHLAQTSTSNTIFNASFLRHACGMSERAVERLGSETEETPKYFKRKYLAAAPLYAWSSSVIHRYLGGRSAFQLSQRFQGNLRDRFKAHQAYVSPEGVVFDDFIDFFSNDISAALLDAMCGKGLIKRNPTFTKAFWIYCDSLPIFMKQTPRFLAPKAYNARKEVLAAVADWQSWACENFDANTTPLDENGDDEFWGTAFFRDRFSTLVYEMGFNPRDMASMELGFLFGYVMKACIWYIAANRCCFSASANVTMNTYWCAIDVFKDKTLLEDIRKEVEAFRTGTKDDLHFDMNRLIQQPILQAVFAESLRLRCHTMFIRKTTEPITVLEWIIPKDRFTIAWSTPGKLSVRRFVLIH